LDNNNLTFIVIDEQANGTLSIRAMPGKNNVAKSAKVDSPEMNSKHNINEHFEILIHKALNIFARNPKEFAAVHSNLRAEVTRYGPAEKGLGDERFLTLEFFDAVTSL